MSVNYEMLIMKRRKDDEKSVVVSSCSRHTKINDPLLFADANVEVLGWSRLPLFRQTITSRGQETFMLLEGETQVALHPGKITLSFHTAQPASPTQPSEGGSLLR